MTNILRLALVALLSVPALSACVPHGHGPRGTVVRTGGGDHDRGHGNDADGHDEDNPGHGRGRGRRHD